MGFSPQQVDHMSVWQFAAALDGWRVAHGGKEAGGEGLTDVELRDMGIEGFQ